MDAIEIDRVCPLFGTKTVKLHCKNLDCSTCEVFQLIPKEHIITNPIPTCLICGDVISVKGEPI